MRRLLPFLAALGGLAALRARRARRAEEPDARALELRRRLDEVKGVETDRAEEEAGEIPVDRAQAVGDVDERRRRLHDEARRAAEEMRGEKGE